MSGAAFLLLACVSSPGPVIDPGDETGGETTDDTGPPTTTADGGTVTDPGEPCNGVDDDGDGVVDEGHSDLDGDGRADCLQCALAAVEAPGVEPTACTVAWTPPEDPWDVELEWEWSIPDGLEEPYGCRTTAIANVDADPALEILCQGHQFFVVDGASGELEVMDGEYAYLSAHAVADVDEDGILDVLGVTTDGTVRALRGDGTEIGRWGEEMGAISPDNLPALDAVLADLYGDGTTWFVNHRGAVSLATGTKDAVFERYDEAPSYLSYDATVADVDDDGVQEVLTFRTLWSPEGWPQWSTSELDYEIRPGGAVLLAASGALSTPVVGWLGLAYQAQIWTIHGSKLVYEGNERDSRWGMHGCAGDLDGDGNMELVAANQNGGVHEPPARILVLTTEGSEVWSTNRPYAASAGGFCAVVDLDGDGGGEVLVTDQFGLHIVDGATGDFLWSSNDAYDSLFLLQQPIPIDLDGDGSLEIVYTNTLPEEGGAPALQVFRHASGHWPPGAPFWASSSWSGTQLQTNGTIPRHPHKPWETTKLWRGMPTTWVPGGDLQVQVVSACASEAEVDTGEVRLAVRVVNRGPEEANTTGTFTVTVTDEGGKPVTLAVQDWDFLGTEEAGDLVEILTDRATAARGLTLSAAHGYDGVLTTQDCDPDNDSLVWTPELLRTD